MESQPTKPFAPKFASVCFSPLSEIKAVVKNERNEWATWNGGPAAERTFRDRADFWREFFFLLEISRSRPATTRDLMLALSLEARSASSSTCDDNVLPLWATSSTAPSSR